MKRITIYLIVLTLSLLVPEYGTDVGKLIPVEVVHLYMEEDQVILETDAGHWGKGETVDTAIRDLHESAPGEIFLDTAEYLLIEEQAADQIGRIREHLKDEVRVCVAQKGIDLKLAAEYLDVHPPEMVLKVAGMGEITQKLEQNEGKLKIS